MSTTASNGSFLSISLAAEVNIPADSQSPFLEDDFSYYHGRLLLYDGDLNEDSPREIGEFQGILIPNLVFERGSTNESAFYLLNSENKTLAMLWDAMQENQDQLFGPYEEQITSLLFIERFVVDPQFWDKDIPLLCLRRILAQFRCLGRVAVVHASPFDLAISNVSEGLLASINERLSGFYMQAGFDHLGDTPFMSMSLA